MFQCPQVILFREGVRGTVTEKIALFQVGWVTYGGVLWKAKGCEGYDQANLLPDQPVLVIGREGNTLLVKPLSCDLSDNLRSAQKNPGPSLNRERPV